MDFVCLSRETCVCLCVGGGWGRILSAFLFSISHVLSHIMSVLNIKCFEDGLDLFFVVVIKYRKEKYHK
jgi:hypothetical protein